MLFSSKNISLQKLHKTQYILEISKCHNHISIKIAEKKYNFTTQIFFDFILEVKLPDYINICLKEEGHDAVDINYKKIYVIHS